MAFVTRIEKVLEILKERFPATMSEVQYHYDLEGEPDEPKEWHHALVDAFIQAEDTDDRPLLKGFRTALIEVGWYRALTPEDLKRITVTSGQKWEFKMNKIPYAPHSGDLRVWLQSQL